MFKPLTPDRNYMHKPDLPSNAMHVVHTRSIYVPHLTLTIYIIFILYFTQRLIFLIVTVFSVRYVGQDRKYLRPFKLRNVIIRYIGR
jgi:hypothetical protein